MASRSRYSALACAPDRRGENDPRGVGRKAYDRRVSSPWEQDHAPTQLRRALEAYRLAMARAERWDGGSLTRRRAELRRLADATGQREQVELVLVALEREHAARPGNPSTVTSHGRIVRDARG